MQPQEAQTIFFSIFMNEDNFSFLYFFVKLREISAENCNINNMTEEHKDGYLFCQRNVSICVEVT